MSYLISINQDLLILAIFVSGILDCDKQLDKIPSPSVWTPKLLSSKLAFNKELGGTLNVGHPDGDKKSHNQILTWNLTPKFSALVKQF